MIYVGIAGVAMSRQTNGIHYEDRRKRHMPKVIFRTKPTTMAICILFLSVSVESMVVQIGQLKLHTKTRYWEGVPFVVRYPKTLARESPGRKRKARSGRKIQQADPVKLWTMWTVMTGKGQLSPQCQWNQSIVLRVHGRVHPLSRM